MKVKQRRSFMKIGLVPGAMKPYHAGHHFLVENALRECDKVIIFTTVKDRDDLSGANMQSAWNELIIPNIEGDVEVSFIKSPVGSVYEVIETENESPSANTYRIYGGTEDVKRFNMERIATKYPNAASRFVNVAAEGKASYLRGEGTPKAKGSWAREALHASDKVTFKAQLPKFLQPHTQRYMEILSR